MANAPPSFAGQDEDENTNNDVILATRDLNENTAGGVSIGKPVSASDADNDVLVYSIRPDPETPASDDPGTLNIQESPTQGSMFSIDGSTGQLKTKDKFDYEAATPVLRTFIVNVIARDPSGSATTQKVTIDLQDVNEAPTFAPAAPTALTVEEGPVDQSEAFTLLKPDGDDLVATDYVATDPDRDASDSDAVDNVTYRLEGADAKYFSIDDEGVLNVDRDQDDDTVNDYAPDFETQSSYSITIVATGKDANIEDTERPRIA